MSFIIYSILTFRITIKHNATLNIIFCILAQYFVEHVRLMLLKEIILFISKLLTDSWKLYTVIYPPQSLTVRL